MRLCGVLTSDPKGKAASFELAHSSGGNGSGVGCQDVLCFDWLNFCYRNVYAHIAVWAVFIAYSCSV